MSESTDACVSECADCDRMAHALREIYEWTKHEPTTLDNDDCTAIFDLVCRGLGIEVWA